MMKFSVIVPVYKVEQYLDRCMESIVNQTYGNLEIIMIDDGSPDACPDICEKWKHKDNRILVIHKENEGLALARNSGLAIASGDYVSFVDSDDYLVPELYAQVAQALETTDADICSFGHFAIDRDGISCNAPMDYPNWITGERVITELLPRTCSTGLTTPVTTYSLVPAWSSIYRRAFLEENKLCFEKIVSEDKLFNLQAFYCAKSVAFVAKPLYAYCENTSSLTKIYRPYLFDSACDLYTRQKELVKKWRLETVMDCAVYASFLTHVHACLKQESKTSDQRAARKKMAIVCGSPLTHEAIKHYPMKNVCLKKRMFYWCVRMRLIGVIKMLLLMNEKTKG